MVRGAMVTNTCRNCDFIETVENPDFSWKNFDDIWSKGVPCPKCKDEKGYHMDSYKMIPLEKEDQPNE